MRILRTLPVSVALLAAVAARGVAQASLAARVAQVRDGVAHVQFDARPGVCGDGRDVIAYREVMFARNFQSFGHWSGVHCVAGLLRVSLTIEGGQVTRFDTRVGGSWPSTESHTTDLGTVTPREASSYFFSLIPRLESSSDKGRLLLPAVLAEDAVVIAPLLALARDAARRNPTRREAIQWLGFLGDSSVIAPLVSVARDGTDDGSERSSKKSLASAAVAALSYLGGGIGVPALIGLSRGGAAATRRDVVFWLGQSGDPRALRTLRAVIADTSEDISVRKHALFSLGQSDGTPTSDLIAAYRNATGRELREHAIFVLSQREDNAATDALLRIAREDADTRMRGKALFWLAQKHDPRVTRLISDILAK